jgi:DHA1 family tetracycline resistance protein-like MFS transporter
LHVVAAAARALVFILVTIALDMLALGMVIPVLPKLVESFLGGDTGRASEIFGLFATAWALMQFVFSPVLGALSDRFGRRPVILISNFGLGLDYIVMAMAPSLTWLFVGRVLSGITAASYSTAMAYITDVAPPDSEPADSACSAPPSVSASSSARPSAVCSAPSDRGCPSGSPAR